MSETKQGLRPHSSAQVVSLDALPIPAAWFDLAELRMRAANRPFEEMFGKRGDARADQDLLQSMLALPETGVEELLRNIRTGELLLADPDVARTAHCGTACALRIGDTEHGQLLVFVLQDAPPQAYAELERTTSILSAILECSFDGLWVWNTTTDSYQMNIHVATLLGYSRDVFQTGENYRTLIHPEDRAFEVETTEQCLETGGPISGQYRMKRADGTWAHVADKAVMLRTPRGSDRIMVGAFRDVSADYEKELATQRAQALREALFINSPTPAVEFDEDYVVVDANVAAAERFGVRRALVVGKPLSKLTGEVAADALKELAQTDSSEAIEIVSGEPGDEQYLLARVIRCTTRGFASYFMLGVDITNQKRISLALEASHELLSQRTEALENANTALQVVLDQAERRRRELQRNVVMNVDTLISPLIERLTPSLRNRPEEQLLVALRSTLQEIAKPFRGTYVTRVPQEAFTHRELEVLQMVKAGLTSQQIAGSLHLSEPTVAFHRSNIRRKLGLTGARPRLLTELGSRTGLDEGDDGATSPSLVPPDD